jgi:hypothetical protein
MTDPLPFEEGDQHIRSPARRQSSVLSKRWSLPAPLENSCTANEAFRSRFPLSGVSAELSRLTVPHERGSVEAFPKKLTKENQNENDERQFTV